MPGAKIFSFYYKTHHPNRTQLFITTLMTFPYAYTGNENLETISFQVNTHDIYMQWKYKKFGIKIRNTVFPNDYLFPYDPVEYEQDQGFHKIEIMHELCSNCPMVLWDNKNDLEIMPQF